MHLSISRRAQLDLDSIWLHIATTSGSEEPADQVLNSISEAIRALPRNPYIGRRRDAELQPGLRSFPAGNYVIIYRVKTGFVRVARVLHGNRDIKALFRAN
jgi:toxin ParE1/3/4